MRYFLTFFLLLPFPASALTLAFPLDCTLGETCFIQNYADRDPSAEYQDYRCGKMTYDGHKGTDIRLRNLVDMQQGVQVLAAAPGVIKGTRDEMDDHFIDPANAALVKNRECGNGVVIAHAGGYETQYCHMMKGSVAVAKGQTVQTGDILGKVGLSGFTEFPHLHLEVRKDATIIDPFVGETATPGCSAERHSIWAATPEYLNGIALDAGFTTRIPQDKRIMEGKDNLSAAAPDAAMLVFWGTGMGLEPGDEVSLTITDPAGKIIVQDKPSYPKAKATAFNFIGKKISEKTPAFAKGTYHGEYAILRTVNGEKKTVSNIIREVQIK